MAAFLRTIEFLGLALWLGSDIFVSLILAPGAFRLLASRDQAGTIVGFSLSRMHQAGMISGFALLIVRTVRMRTIGSLAAPAAVCVALMVILTAISQYTVSARMAALRVQMGSIQATATDSPLLAEFGWLHRVSASLEGCVLLLGTAAMYLMVRELH
jgi:uncharacterized membrane protein